MNQSKPAHSNFDLTFENFDFNLNYMKFVGELFNAAYPTKIEELARGMRIWGLERSAHADTRVTYKVSADTEAGKVWSGKELISLPHDQATYDDSNVVTVLLAITSTDSQLTNMSPIAPIDALALFDKRFNEVRATIPDPYRGAYNSMRHLIATAARAATAATVRAESLTFFFTEGDITYVFKVNLAHFTLGENFPTA